MSEVPWWEKNRRDDPNLRELQAQHNGVPKELPTTVKSPCNECPWRRAAAPGWLGPHSAEEWAQAIHGESPIMCHKTCNPDHSYEGVQQCRGAAIMRANSAKVPRRSDTALGPEDHATCFSNTTEFIDHHTGGIPRDED